MNPFMMPLEQRKRTALNYFQTLLTPSQRIAVTLLVLAVMLVLLGYFGAQALTDGAL